MAVITSTLINDWLDLADRQFTYGAKFRVKTDDRDMPAQDVLLGAALASPDPIPSFFASFSLKGSSDVNAFAQSYSVKRAGGGQEGEVGRVWEITVTWEPMENPDDDTTSDDDPLARPVRIDPYEEEIEEPVEEGWNVEALTGISRAADTFGPICNAAGCEPGTPLMRKRIIPGLKFTKNVANIAAFVSLRDAFVGKLNSGSFYDAPAKKAFCSSITCSTEMFAGGTSYREVYICVLADAKGFAIPLVNRGFNVLQDGEKAPGTVWDPVKERDVISSEPVNLNLNGTQTATNTMGTVINWRIHDTANFAGLGVGG